MRRDDYSTSLICISEKPKYLFAGDWTGQIDLKPKENLAFWRTPGRGRKCRCASANDELFGFDRSQKFLGLLARGKTADIAIVGIVFGCVRRVDGEKLSAVLTYRFFHPPRCPGAPPLERGAGPNSGPDWRESVG